ncbi:MAG: hypothetical protein HPY51_20205 [Candidatus Omnitrophica bacterium]|nr:hypothetical protein [Candidatus Omnitrophota bacterium]
MVYQSHQYAGAGSSMKYVLHSDNCYNFFKNPGRLLSCNFAGPLSRNIETWLLANEMRETNKKRHATGINPKTIPPQKKIKKNT